METGMREVCVFTKYSSEAANWVFSMERGGEQAKKVAKRGYYVAQAGRDSSTLTLIYGSQCCCCASIWYEMNAGDRCFVSFIPAMRA